MNEREEEKNRLSLHSASPPTAMGGLHRSHTPACLHTHTDWLGDFLPLTTCPFWSGVSLPSATTYLLPTTFTPAHLPAYHHTLHHTHPAYYLHTHLPCLPLPFAYHLPTTPPLPLPPHLTTPHYLPAGLVERYTCLHTCTHYTSLPTSTRPHLCTACTTTLLSQWLTDGCCSGDE